MGEKLPKNLSMLHLLSRRELTPLQKEARDTNWSVFTLKGFVAQIGKMQGKLEYNKEFVKITTELQEQILLSCSKIKINQVERKRKRKYETSRKL